MVMTITRNFSIACIAAVLSACAAAPNKPVAPAAATLAKSTVTPAVADISGNWILTVNTPQGGVDAKMTVVQAGSAISGTLDSSMGVVDYTGSVNGKEVKFNYSIEKFGAPPGSIIDYVGKIEGTIMSGTAKFASFGSGDWSAKRP
jgi:hypothetical protein